MISLIVPLATLLAAAAPSIEDLSALLREPILANDECRQEACDYLGRETFRRRALNGVEISPERWPAASQALRDKILAEVVFRGQATEWRKFPTHVEWFDELAGGPGYRIRKLRFQAVPGLWIPALLYEPTKIAGRVPAVLNVNGHDPNGMSAPVEQVRSINLAKRGIISLHPEWLGMGQLSGKGFRHGLLNQLDLCGTSGLAVFYLAMSRGVDILLAHDHVDSAKIAMTGLSGGGWQTILLSSLDPRIALACPVAGYSSFTTRAANPKDLGDSEQTPADLATIADYADLTALLAPRYAMLTYCQKDDCCFEAPYALPPLEQFARPIYQRLGHPERFRTYVNHDPGTHNYLKDNREAFYAAVADYFYPGDSNFQRAEIPCDDEVKTAKDLSVPMPPSNRDFSTLARQLAEKLPRIAKLPTDAKKAQSWRDESRKKLRAIVRPAKCQFTANEASSRNSGDFQVRYLRLTSDEYPMTLPVVEIAPTNAKETAVVLADSGKNSAASLVKAQLDANRRVLVADLMSLGERTSTGYLIPLLFDSLGQRPLGIQSGELSGLLEWAATSSSGAKPLLFADGPRSSLAALVAVALAPDRVSKLELHRALGSLKQLIQSGDSVDTHPEAFCFGLLDAMDLRQIAALVPPNVLETLSASSISP